MVPYYIEKRGPYFRELPTYIYIYIYIFIYLFIYVFIYLFIY